MTTEIKGAPFSSVPQYQYGSCGLYSVVQNNSGQKIVGTLEHVVEEFCGMCAYYPYTLDGRDHDDWTSHVHFFDNLLSVVLDNPATFSITDEMKQYYSEQQLQIINAFQKALLKAKDQKQADVAERSTRGGYSEQPGIEEEA